MSGDNVPRMSAPPPGWSLQRPFEKETTAAEWFESTDIPLMAVVRGITEIPARSLEVTANYACILATGKRCDGSDPTPEDLESGYYSLMPGGGKGAGNILKPLGRGSTINPAKGRFAPRNLREQLAVEQAMTNPTAGKILPLKMTDPRWPAADGWVKVQQIIKPGGKPITVHYLRNTKTGAIDDFKIVD